MSTRFNECKRPPTCAGEKCVQSRSAPSRRPPDVAMMQPSDSRKRHDLPEQARLDAARGRRVTVEAQVRAILVVVGDVLADQVEEVTLAEHDHMVEQLAT